MKLALAVIAALAGLALASPASAQVLTVRDVQAQCPDLATGVACPAVSSRFLENRTRGSRLNRQIVDLVVTIAEAAQQNNVPRNVCLNAADGLRVLATGVTVDEQAGQIRDIADALCAGNRTAAIGRQGNRVFLLDSLSGGSSGGGVAVASNGAPPNNATPPIVLNPDGSNNCSSPGNSNCSGSSEDSGGQIKTPPGQDKKDDDKTPPGQDKKDDDKTPPGQDKKDDDKTPPGQEKKDDAPTNLGNNGNEKLNGEGAAHGNAFGTESNSDTPSPSEDKGKKPNEDAGDTPDNKKSDVAATSDSTTSESSSTENTGNNAGGNGKGKKD